MDVSYIHNHGEEPLKYLTVGQLAEAAALKYGNYVAVHSLEQNIKLTFLETLEKADKFSAGLHALGMRKGDKLGIWAPNCIEWYIVNLACMRSGILAVPLNTSCTALEVGYAINKVGIKFMVCHYEGKHNKYYEILMEIDPDLRHSEKGNYLSSRVPSLKGIVLISETHKSNAYVYEDVIEMGSSSIPMCHSNFVDPDDICYLNFSSGTTGKPKAIIVTHFQIVNNSYLLAKNLGYNSTRHSICVQVPLFHVFGTVATINAALHFGTTMVLPTMYYNSKKNAECLNDGRCSMIYGTPTMFTDLINIQKKERKQNDFEFEAFIGGAPSTPEYMKQLSSVLNIKKTIVVSYGLTEATGSVFISQPDEEFGTAGYLGDNLEVKLINSNGITVPLGQSGEICVRGYSVMLGYYGDEENSKKVIHDDRWLRTGDIGILQSNGHIKIVGRTTDMIIRGGENIYPKEIEDLLCTHPSVLDAQVIGVLNERLGEEVCACLILRDGFDLTLSEVSSFCLNKIARYKIPTKLKILKEFPKTISGKPQKNILKIKINEGLY